MAEETGLQTNETAVGNSAEAAGRSGVDVKAQQEYEQQRAFQTAFAAAPTPMVTYVLIAVNLLVYVAMVLRGVPGMDPSASDVVPWGANLGPLTLGGQWWRLITSCFIHFGLIHVGMNMFILFQVGIFAEKLFGNVRYLLLYLLAGVGGSLAGLFIHPMVTAAGASGAVFGVYGGLLAYLLVQRGVVPKSASLSIAKSAGIFLAYNLVYGLSNTKTDLTAHIGGLLTGFVVGSLLARPLSPDGQRIYPVRTAAVALGGIAMAYYALGAVPRTEIPDGAWYQATHFAPSVSIGKNDRVMYTGSANKADADKMAHALLDEGFFVNPDVLLVLHKGVDGTSLSIPIWKDEASTKEPMPWDDAAFVAGMQMFGVEAAPSVGGPPMKVLIVNSKGVVKKTIEVNEHTLKVGTKDEVWYSGDATREQAEGLGKALLEARFFRDHGGRATLSRRNGKTDLGLMVRENSWNEANMVPVFEDIGRKAAGSIGGLPVQVELLDGNSQSRKTLLVQ